MAKPTLEDYRNQMASMKHLIRASKDINDWKFELQPRPKDGAKSTVGIYVGKCSKSDIVNLFPIDEADVKYHGSIENVIKHFHRGFAKSLTVLGQAIIRARAEKINVLLPRHVNHARSAHLAGLLLAKGDHGH